MATHEGPRVESADKLESGGLLITFDDGKCAVYSNLLLRDMFDKAEEVVGLGDLQQIPESTD